VVLSLFCLLWIWRGQGCGACAHQYLDAVQYPLQAEDELIVRAIRDIENTGRDEGAERGEAFRVGQLGQCAVT
jgi:hypothetical protein